jgi:imidazolonepropionase-like amidohydrolase
LIIVTGFFILLHYSINPLKFFMKRTLPLFLILLTFTAFSQRTVIHCGNLIDGKSNDVQTQMTLIVEGNKITRIEKGFTKPAAADKLIDLSKKTIMPGLIDLHVHLESETNKEQSLQRFTLNKADVAFRSTVFAKKTLMAGFTTVRDLGGSGVNTSLRNAINQGIVVGPRIFSVGKSIATTGGHADPTNGYREDLMGDPGPKEGVINSPEDARQAVRQRYKDGSDLIKITATGGVLSIAKDGSGPQFTDEELKAIVETAKDYGMHTAAHAHGTEGMKRAVLAGITTIEHGTKMTEEVMDLMKQKGTYYVPTISAGKFVAEKAKESGYYHPLVVPKALEIGPQIQETFGKAYKRGVKIAFGTDAGVFPHGDNGKEFGYMMEAGMPAMETIKAATVVAAEVLGLSDKIGTIEVGKFADIVATDDNPLKNIKTMEKVSFVMKEGVVYLQ